MTLKIGLDFKSQRGQRMNKQPI